MLVLPCSKLNAQAKVIYTGNEKIDMAAEAIILRCTNDKMTNKEKLIACYNYLVKKMYYTHGSRKVQIHVTAKEKKIFKEKRAQLKKAGKITYSNKFRKDYSHLLTLSGTCKHMSGVMCILANHLGYKAGYCTGRYIRSNGTSTEHWWNYVVVNGKKLYCDVQAANCSWKSHHSQKAVNNYCLKDKNSRVWRKHHR